MMETNEKYASKAQVRVILTDEELQLPAIDDLCNKYYDWLKLSKESAGGRKTRAANRRVDTIYDEIMAFKLPPVKLEATVTIPASPTRPQKVMIQSNGHANNNLNSTKTSIDGDSEGSSVASSGPASSGRTLRPRCRTPSVSRKQETPCTPTHQSIRVHMKKTLDSNSSNVLSAALNQEHSSGPASMTKIRALLRLDSAKKKREEEKERQEKARLERKAKEEKAEAQKKKMLEERAQTAKMNREQRLQHAAEVRKAREKANIERKLREAIPTGGKNPQADQANQTQTVSQQSPNVETALKHVIKPLKQVKQAAALPNQVPQVLQTQVHEKEEQQEQQQEQSKQQAKPRKLDETFQKPANSEDNIDISILDETSDEPSKKPNAVAKWAKAPDLRNHVVDQFKKSNEELMRLIIEIFGRVKLPVDLDEIFASHKPVNRKYLARTSSACWTPPPKLPKRSNTEVSTPVDPTKRARDHS